ncbi:hypothetical protein ABIC49_006095 [Burkholderia ambifaria]
MPRDRDGSFEQILIPKQERRFTGFDERIIAMYARGMSVRQIQGFLAEHYGTEVSPDFISSVTGEVMVEALSWQNAGASEERLVYDRSGRLIDAVNRYSRVQFFFDPVGNLVREHMDDHYCCNYQNRK